MGGRSWTELFFLDEATAFAAGHRPCFFCRRDDANRFRAAWEAGNGVGGYRAPEIDAVLHRERLQGGKKRLHALPMPLEKLPDGAMVQAGGESYLIAQRPCAAMVACRLRRGAGARRCDAADAALDAARVRRRLSAGAASECGLSRVFFTSSCMDGLLSARACLVFRQTDRGAVMYTASECGR